ncbi:pectate lyase [Ilyomonas limi]|uniref:Pectate lyase n=2 Tax=Ilyomonas limi TaxID=2575867 RepID=A0A4U3KTU8_9BACT|nr:pectate lyase [Ilyomonas limi]
MQPAVSSLYAQKKKVCTDPICWSGNDSLIFNTDAQGNRIPDFSYAGYSAGEKEIPDVPVKIVVPVMNGDATAAIQNAINYVAKLPADSNGVRGAVLLQKGTYTVEGSLYLNKNGVVLRGSGMQEGGTILYGAGTDRATLINVGGVSDKKLLDTIAVTDAYVPVNSMQLTLAANAFKKGDPIIIHVPFTEKWIDAIHTKTFGGGLSALGWKPGERFLDWDRTITAVNGNIITVDAPITTAIDSTLTHATVSKYTWNGRVQQCGVENMQLVSAYDTSNPKDEAHRWFAININNAQDVWVRQITFRHFAGSAVAAWETTKRISVEDCASLQPVSEIGGWRRITFFTNGQQILFKHCYAEHGFHDFATGYCAPGPNAFVQCESYLPYSFSGGINSWASGTLMDIMYVDGNAISFMNRGQDGQGAGWASANSVCWNCSAARIDCYQPPTAQNWAFGSWSQFAGDGFWAESNNSIEPWSLYYYQLQQRIGDAAKGRDDLFHITTNATSSPTVQQAAALSDSAMQPAITVLDWIEQSPQRHPVNTNAQGAITINDIQQPKPVIHTKEPSLTITNGWLVINDTVVSGGKTDVQWWNGSVDPKGLLQSKPHITRWVPGRTGQGLTDDLHDVVDTMLAHHIVTIDHNYALWYERRRDDHERIRRMDGDVWPPYYELPFARSGKDTAWDGLSKYNLTKYNKWYWNRLQKFADLADANGLVLFHQNYFQHNILEAGAHYVDFPWRTANNINNTGFPEPPNYAGDKRNFMAEQFYDTTNAHRRELNIAYINHCLNNFAGNSNVIQFISAEYTGPLHFVQFWLNTIRNWEAAHNKKELIALSTTKDVQDSILTNKNYSDVVDVIDIRYWNYQRQGELYAPKGGQHLAPRQHARLLKPKAATFEDVYHAVSEYKLRYPTKVVIYNADNYDHFGWAVLMGGGSLPVLPTLQNKSFLKAASRMQPQPLSKDSAQLVLMSPSKDLIIYSNNNGRTVHLEAPVISRTYHAVWIDPATGKTIANKKIKIAPGVAVAKPQSTELVLWLSSK